MATDSEIAIVGVGCRFPGANNLDEFWRVLVNGENHVKEIPVDRWKNSAFYSDDKDAAGKIYVKKAGLIKSYDSWDPQLFGISEAEAERVDPQQRHVLECVYMALEDGGITRDIISGSQTGVYIGAMNNDYQVICNRGHEDDTPYTATGESTTIISARVSYVFNLHGPCLTLDTACSSALMAIHLGAQAILTGDCDMAICGGVNIMMSPDMFIPLCRNRMMSAVGQCQTFCNTADGYARGEGCGIVILKRLSQAAKDSNKIWAVVMTGTNQDGRDVQPITAPSTEQQEKLLEKTYRAYSIDPARVQYIEAHGTGTIKGDPAETNALGRFFSKYRSVSSSQSHNVLVGSVKTNIGHTESAAGVAGLIKVLLMMKHGVNVPSLHLKHDKSNINPELMLRKHDLEVPIETSEWKKNTDGERIGCVNSFGFGGSNCHAIILQKSSCHTAVDAISNGSPDLDYICLSSPSLKNLNVALSRFKEDLSENREQLSCIAYTSTCCRTHYKHRICFVANNRNDLREQVSNVTVENKYNNMDINVVFVYCGVGTSWTGMCSTLMKTDKHFRESVEKVDRYIKPLAQFSIAEKFRDPKTEYNDPFINHIAIFTAQVGLTDMWRNVGVNPDVILGQSVGEVAAAYASGSLSLKTAVDVIFHRSKVLANITRGSMMVVKNIDVREVEKLCDGFAQRVTVAVYSSPVACTLSGDAELLKEIKAQLKDLTKGKGNDIQITELDVSCAYHSHHVDPCITEMKDRLKHLKPHTRLTPLVSTVTGSFASDDEFQTGDYWAQNSRYAVRLFQALNASAKSSSKNIFLEIGPKQILAAHFRDIFTQDHFYCFPSMRYRKEIQAKSSTIRQLYEHGLEIKWESIYPKKNVLSSIPRHVFSSVKTLYIPEAEKRRLNGLSDMETIEHSFVRRSVSSEAHIYIMISQRTTPFVFEHSFAEKVLVPGATYVESALAISCRMLNLPTNQVELSVEFQSPIYPVPGIDLNIDCAVNKKKSGLSIAFSKDGRVSCIANACRIQSSRRPCIDTETIKYRCCHFMTQQEIYDRLADYKLKYGPSLKLIQCSWSSDSECLADLMLSETLIEESNDLQTHPAVVDAVFQLFSVLNSASQTGKRYFLPKGIGSIVTEHTLQQRMCCYMVQSDSTDNQIHFNALLLTSDGITICEIKDLYYQELREAPEKQPQIEYSLDWRDKSDIEPIWDSQKNKVLMFGTGRTKTFFQSKLGKLDTLYIPLSCLSGQSKSDLKSNLQNLNMRDMLAVLYAPMISNDPMSSDSIDLYETAKNNCMCLSNLLSTMNKLLLKLPVYVVTENTQSIPKRKPEHLCINGSELWGLVRCLQHESLYPKIYLLDINPKECGENSLYNILLGRYSKEDELAINGESVYVSKFNVKPTGSESASSRFIQLEERDLAYLKSTTPFSLKEPVLEYHDRNYKNQIALVDNCCIRISSICVHRDELYTTCADTLETKFEVWPELRKGGFQVVVVEGEGIVTNGDTSSQNKTVCFCYPVDAATYVDVPRECLVNKDDIPYYMPGMLTVANLVFRMSETVKESQPVCILAQRSDTFAEMFLAHLLQYHRHCTVNTMNIIPDPIKETCISQDKRQNACMVVMSKIDISMAMRILDKFPNLGQIVTISELMPKSVIRWIRHNHSRVDVSIVATEKLFEVHTIRTSFPEMQKHLTDFCKKNQFIYGKASENSDHRQLFCLPYRSLDIVTDMKPGIPLRVGKSQLFRRNCCYIIVGGLTGLGWQILEFIAEMGGGYIVTMNRRSVSDTKRNEINKIMRDRDVRITSMQVDITDLKSLQSAFVQLQEGMNGITIKGIFNGAGVLADSLLVNMSEQELDKAMKPKILGSWNLHLVAEGLELDYFVLHSSIVSVLGNAGQSNYGAGGSFVDALARYRRSRNLCAQTLNWGALSVGMAQENDNVALQLHRKGIGFLSVSDIRTLLTTAFLTDEVQLICGRLDLPVMGKHQNVSKLQKEGLEGRQNGMIKETGSVENMLDFSVYFDSNEAGKYGLLVEFVQTMVCHAVPGLTKESLTVDTKTAQYFFDSLEAVVFTNRLFDHTRCKLDVQLLYLEDTTIGGIAAYLLQHIGVQDIVPVEMTVVDPLLDTDTNVSFMEKSVLLDYVRNTNNPFLNRIIDLEIHGVNFDIDLWRSVIHQVVSNNKELCKIYIIRDKEFDAKYLSDEEITVDFEITPFESIKDGDARSEFTFDLTREIPIKFRMAHQSGCICIRMVLHAVIADLASVTVIYKDISDTINAMLSGEHLSLRKAHINVAHTIHSKVSRKFADLKRFWRTYLDILTQPTILDFIEKRKIDGTFSRCITNVVPNELTTEVLEFTKRKGLTLFQFFTSLYQLYLHRKTGSSIVPVITNVDMRMHAPELKKYVGRCLNNVILAAVFRDKQVIEEFITENSSNISSAVEHSGYPYALIGKELLSESLLRQVGRHRIVMDNMSEIDKVAQDENAHIKIKNIWHTRDEYETFWYIYYNTNTKHISYRFGFNAAVFGEECGTKLTNELLSLILECVNYPRQVCTLRSFAFSNAECNVKDKIDAGKEPNSFQTDSNKYLEQKRGNKVSKSDTSFKNLAGVKQQLSSKQRQEHQDFPDWGSVTNGVVKAQGLHEERIIKSGIVRKQTTTGWDHKVDMAFKVKLGQTVSSTSYLLEWRKPGCTLVKKLPLAFIKEIKLYPGPHEVSTICIQTSKRKYILKLNSRDAVEWMDCFESEMNRLSSLVQVTAM